MSQFLEIHPDNPQHRLIQRSVEILNKGGVIVYPNDTGYALGCHLGDKNALERIIQIRRLDSKHHFTLICRDLSEVSAYASFDTPVYRLLKAYTPGPYTFLLKATRTVPRRLMHPKKRTIGLRIPDHIIALHILEELNEPMLTTTLIMPEDEYPLQDPEYIRECLENKVDLIIDSGQGGLIPTTLIDLTNEVPVILRKGLGDCSPFENN